MLAKRTSKLLFSTAIFLLVVAITHETTGNKIKEIIMKKLTIVSILLLAVTMNIYAQEKDFPKLKGPFLGQKPPVKEPIIFADGIVLNAHCSSAFSPDGKEVYFEIGTENDYSTKIGYSKIINGAWTKPEVVSFCKEDTYQSGNPFITPDNKKMLFTSFAPIPGIEKEHRRDGQNQSPLAFLLIL